MAKRKTLVRWQDGTYDKHLEKCEACGVDHYVAGEDLYKEITSNQGYHDWLEAKNNVARQDDEFHESSKANPNKLEAGQDDIWTGGEAYPPASLARLEAAVAALTEKQREVWELVYVKGKTQGYAAEALGISQSTVNEHASAALAKVRKFMGVKN